MGPKYPRNSWRPPNDPMHFCPERNTAHEFLEKVPHECLMRLYKCFRMNKRQQGEIYYCTMCQQSEATHHPTLFDLHLSIPTCTLCLVWRPVGNKQNRAGDDGTTSREGGGTAGFRNNSVAPQLVSLFSFASAAASAAAAAGTSITYGTRTGGAHTRGSRLVHPHPEEIEN